MLSSSAILLPLWAYLLVSFTIIAGGFISGIILGFVMWLEDKWFVSTAVAGTALSAMMVSLFFGISG